MKMNHIHMFNCIKYVWVDVATSRRLLCDPGTFSLCWHLSFIPQDHREVLLPRQSPVNKQEFMTTKAFLPVYEYWNKVVTKETGHYRQRAAVLNYTDISILLNIMFDAQMGRFQLELFICIAYFSTVVPLTSCVLFPVRLSSLTRYFQQVLYFLWKCP